MTSKSSKQRGISTIVGTFIFLVLMVAFFGAILVAFQYQTNLVNSNNALANAQINKIKEQFTLNPVLTSSGSTCSLSLNVMNTGTNPVQIMDLWVVNTSDGTLYSSPIPLSPPSSYVPPSTTILFVNQLSAISLSSGNFAITAVSALGNKVSSNFSCPPLASSTEGDVIQDKLIAKPSVYAAFPNPIYSSNSQNPYSYYALILANPTSQTMYVNKVAVQFVSPQNPTLIGNTMAGTTSFTTLPTTEWTPDTAGKGGDGYTLYWKGSTPVKIAPVNATSFKVIVQGTASTKNSPITTINTNSYTTFGQFGGAKIDTISFNGSDTVVPNVFQSTTVTSNGTGTNVRYFIQALPSSTTNTFYVSMNNTTGQPLDTIKVNSYLIVNIPKDFQYVTYIPTTACQANLVDDNDNHLLPTQPLIIQPDGSTQLRFKLTASIDNAHNLTCEFTAQTPSKAADHLYLFYIYNAGRGGASKGSDTVLMGSVAETVVQVCGQTKYNAGPPPFCSP